jgi:hypothetical protein
MARCGMDLAGALARIRLVPGAKEGEGPLLHGKQVSLQYQQQPHARRPTTLPVSPSAWPPKSRAVRPAAAPNPGFMAALLELEVALRGASSLGPGDLLGKRGKPAPRMCPLCGDAVGVSASSLAVHLRSRHKESAAAVAASAAAPADRGRRAMQ